MVRKNIQGHTVISCIKPNCAKFVPVEDPDKLLEFPGSYQLPVKLNNNEMKKNPH